LLQICEEHGSQLGGVKDLLLAIVHHFGSGETILGGTEVEVKEFVLVLLDFGFVEVSSNQSLEVGGSVLEVHHLLGFGGFSQKPLVSVERDHGGGKSVGNLVGHNIDSSVAGDCDAGLVISEINSDNRHLEGLL